MTPAEKLKALQAFVADHLSRYLSTNGEDGYWLDASLFGGKGMIPSLLLTTTGRKSGNRITTPMMFMQFGPEEHPAYVVVASKGGAPDAPNWYLNLQANPQVQVQIRANQFSAAARTANAAERAVHWPQLVALFPGFERYQSRTERQIPVVILEAVES